MLLSWENKLPKRAGLEKKLKSKEEKIELVKQALPIVKRAAEEIKVFGRLEDLLSGNDEPTSKKRRVS